MAFSTHNKTGSFLSKIMDYVISNILKSNGKTFGS